MLVAVIGVLMITVGFVWMYFCGTAGYAEAWWYFEWRIFQFILGALLVIGSVLFSIGMGLRAKKKKKNANEGSQYPQA